MTDAEKQAERLLPCTSHCNFAAYPYSQVIAHSSDCPYSRRPAIAAALAEKDSETALYKQLYDEEKEVYQLSVNRENELRAALKAAENRVKSLEALLGETQLSLAEDWRDRRDALLAEGKKG